MQSTRGQETREQSYANAVGVLQGYIGLLAEAAGQKRNVRLLFEANAGNGVIRSAVGEISFCHHAKGDLVRNFATANQLAVGLLQSMRSCGFYGSRAIEIAVFQGDILLLNVTKRRCHKLDGGELDVRHIMNQEQ